MRCKTQMRYKKMLTAGLVMLSTLTLAACGNSSKSNNSSAASGGSAKLVSDYNMNGKGTTAGNNSTLKIGEVADSPFAGISSPTLISKTVDNDVYSPGGENTLFNTDKNYKIVDGGLANLKLDKNTKTATITLRNNAKWSNGMKVTAKDVEYPYEILANKDSQSPQYSSQLESIKGLSDYHAGKANGISGITYPNGQNGRVVKIHYNNFPPALQYSGNPFMWSAVEPYEYMKVVPIDKLSASDQVRKNPIFTGPYKLTKQIQGESTNWEPNKYYWGPKPHIKNISIQVVSSNNFGASAKAKKFDYFNGAVNSQYPNVKSLGDYTNVGRSSLSYTYFGFNVGYAKNNGENTLYKNTKMGNKNLRQAMMYSLDLDTVNKKFSNGLSWRANSFIVPAFGKYHDNNLSGFPYNPDKAKKLLDDAGYKQKGKWRVQPNGKPLTINYGTVGGSSTSEAVSQYEVQQWRSIGLNVQFVNGKPMDFNSMYSILLKPKQNNIDVYNGGFSVSSEPTPSQFTPTGAFNMGHFATKESTQLLNNMNNEKSWNDNYRLDQFKKWQAYMNDQAAYAPASYSYAWSPVNHRVANYSTSPDDNYFFSNLQLNSPNPK